jgi:thioredoxin 1
MANVITDINFRELINGDKPVVVDFWAEWCGPCRMVGPIIEELAKEYEGKVFIGKLNVDENEETPLEFGIRSIPTILFFKGGELVDKVVGATTKPKLEEKIKNNYEL